MQKGSHLPGQLFHTLIWTIFALETTPNRGVLDNTTDYCPKTNIKI